MNSKFTPHMILVTLVAMCMPCFQDMAVGGTIRTQITSKYGIPGPGIIDMQFEIDNSGPDTAYNVSATVFLADWVRKHAALGDLPQGGNIRFDRRYEIPDLLPGTYTAAVTVDFEDESGRAHRAHHIFEIEHLPENAGYDSPEGIVELETPVFNNKSLFSRKEDIRFYARNDVLEPVMMNLRFLLPDGARTENPVLRYRLDPGVNIRKTIPLSLAPWVREECAYRVVVWTELNGTHYSGFTTKKIRFMEKPYYMKPYLIAGISLLMLIYAFAFMRHRRNIRQ